MSALEGAFAGRFSAGGWHNEAVATFPSQHPEVGDVVVAATDDEIELHVGDITHGHFCARDHTPEALHDVADHVVDFLRRLFADRVVVWRGRLWTGGWNELAEGEPPRKRGKEAFVWSGPLT